MPYYTKLGEIPPKRHIQFRRPDGVLYSEEVFGTEGFVGPTSTMYHIHPPTQVSGWEIVYSTEQEYLETNVMRMRHLTSQKMSVKCQENVFGLFLKGSQKMSNKCQKNVRPTSPKK